ncbi:MAG: hypothetical protein ACPL1Y_05205 [Thermoplasmata archaeon]
MGKFYIADCYAADMAVNPMPSGSGINTRMIEYFAYGLPVISTPIGVRGFPGIKNGENVIISELDDFSSGIRILSNSPELRQKIGIGARQIIEKYFDTMAIGKKAYEVIDTLWQSKYGK